MKLTLDVENTVTHRDGKLHLDPFEANNTLVMVGMLTDKGDERIVTFDHSECEPDDFGHTAVQEWLDKTTVLICHNAAHDLLWIWESGFKYDGDVFDTMLGEYVLQRGQKEPLSLEACAERYALDTKKQDTLKEYFKKGYSTRDIPHAELSEYLSADLHATQQLSDKLYGRLSEDVNVGLLGTMELTNNICKTLTRIYQRGFAVDLSKLDEVRQLFEQERTDLQDALQKHIRQLMGDTPINLNSPEQLSSVVYSRRVIDKPDWSSRIDPFMGASSFRTMVNTGTDRVYKTIAKQCTTCKGSGSVWKKKKNGENYAKPSHCTVCNSKGYTLSNTNMVAGLQFKPPSAKWASANGFSTSKQKLELLETAARSKGLVDTQDFLIKVRRLSAIGTYLTSFVEGIETHTKADGKLHVRLLQHRTSTGRLSGANPNMQNMPRGGTFPIKKVFVSRFTDGKILEADFGQLEFRAAAYLSQDAVAIEEVTTGFDVHAYTSKVISDAGQKTSRQEAKAHTFAPLYGATGYGRTPAEAAYYTHFTQKYQGIADWHAKLAKEAINTGKIITPSGREFSFPDVRRNSRGKVSHFTQIKNFPVQSFATADIVPIALLHIEKLLANMESCIVNTVHDDIILDVHPNEERSVLNIISLTNRDLIQLIDTRWDLSFNVPLALEAKIGPNWLDTKDVSC
jgi:DNA polymerase I-like protein with 3'-5' exonuclease and polymerase domains